MSDCRKFELTLRRIGELAEMPVPDDLALHLDACPACRSLFDRAKIPMSREDFEGLSAQGRVRLLRTMGAARAARPWKMAAAAMAAMVLLALAAVFYLQRASAPATDPISVALVEDHIRYLDHPDRQGRSTIEEYTAHLQSYVDFPVMIPSLASARLTGARRCFLLGRRAALAFYESREGSASYFAFPGEDLALPRDRCTGDARFACSAIHGYQVVSWKEAGLIHAFVGSSRLSLLDMAKACRSRNSG
ncbi:MAG: hypothetical protein HY568_01420 [Candidatus Latescibacteria bacterium]|nr:hypothetical protein [Candidatus Latescibacterota bacterium]